jgi:hypothetical protein
MTVADYILASPEDVGFEQLFSPSTGVSHLVDSLLGDVKNELPPLLASMHHRQIVSVGRSGTGSFLHRHDSSWLFLSSGVKEWLLLPPSTSHLDEAQEANPCTLRAEFPDLDWSTCTQHAGEILYLPKGTWHATCNLPDVNETSSATETMVLGAGAQGLAKQSDRLFYAARDGNISEIDKMCLEAPFTRSTTVSAAPSPSPDTAMHVAASHDRILVMEHLMAAQCGGSWMMHAFAGPTGDLPVHHAARYGSLNVMRSMLQGEPGLANAISKSLRRTPLHSAAYYGHVAVIDMLLSSGAEIDAKLSSGDTPVHRAAEGSQLAALQVLLDRGGDPMALDNAGLPAVHMAAQKGHQAVVLWFLNLPPPGGYEQLLLLAKRSRMHWLSWKAHIRAGLLNATSPLGAAAIASSGDPGFLAAFEDASSAQEL